MRRLTRAALSNGNVILPAVVLLLADVLGARADFFSERRDLANVYVHENDVIRVFYDTFGQHAVNPADVNGNGVPDQVEDVARQSWAAYHLLTDTLGFQDPLESERYQLAEYIDVNMLSEPTLNGNNGIAYDGLSAFNRPMDPAGVRVITFDVATSVNPATNTTPTHELFHLVQNGYTFFKTRWYTEGMARWSEHATDAGGLGPIDYSSAGPWPQTTADRQQLFGLTYTAESYVWNPLAALDDAGGAIAENLVSPAIKELTYATTSGPVLEDFELVGAELMRQVLEELAVMDDVAYAALGYASWSEANQQSLTNSPFIYQAILDVARRRGHGIGPYVAVPGPGDFNADGVVNRADLLQWAGDFGVNDSSDADFDDDSDGADFLAWQRHLDVSSAGSAGGRAVPEPGSATLLLGLVPAVRTRFTRKNLRQRG